MLEEKFLDFVWGVGRAWGVLPMWMLNIAFRAPASGSEMYTRRSNLCVGAIRHHTEEFA